MSDNKLIIESSILYSSPSFFKGIARSGDLFGQLDEYNYSDTEAEADNKALAWDWYVVGSDISQSMDDINEQIETSTT